MKKFWDSGAGAARLLALLLLPCGDLAAADPGLFDWGFWASRRVDADGNLRYKAAGPFFERMTAADGKTFTALRPFYSTLRDPAEARQLTEAMWPLATSKTVQNQYSWRVLVAMGTDFDAEQPGSRYRTWILPVYFQGRDREGASYLGLFPIAGSVHEFLGRDRASWALFPLYLHSEVNDVESTSLLWPVYSRTRGEGVEKFRVFPFYGHSAVGEVQRRFLMWPFWNSGTWPGGSGFILFPVYGRLNAGDVELRYYLPPLFKTSRGGASEITHAPWPLFQRSEGETGKLYLWPLFGSKTIGGVERSFVLWPVFWKTVTRRSDQTATRQFAVPFWQHTSKADADGVEQSSYWKLWPLCSRRREGSAVRFRAFDVWPRGESGPVQRNYAPLWTVYSRYVNGGHSDTELLWGLYRHSSGDGLSASSIFPLFDTERSPERSSWSLLKGLLAREQGVAGSSWRFLYILRFGNSNRYGASKQ